MSSSDSFTNFETTNLQFFPWNWVCLGNFFFLFIPYIDSNSHTIRLPMHMQMSRYWLWSLIHSRQFPLDEVCHCEPWLCFSWWLDISPICFLYFAFRRVKIPFQLIQPLQTIDVTLRIQGNEHQSWWRAHSQIQVVQFRSSNGVKSRLPPEEHYWNHL